MNRKGNGKGNGNGKECRVGTFAGSFFAFAIAIAFILS